MAKRYYWNRAGMTRADIEAGGWFSAVKWDELGISADGMSEDDLEAEMQCFAAVYGWSESATREFFAGRVIDNIGRDRAWERYLQTGER